MSTQMTRGYQLTKGDRYVVIDDLLPPTAFEEARAEFDSVALKPGLSAIDPVYDGFNYRGGRDKVPLSTEDVGSTMRSAVVKEIKNFSGLFDEATRWGREVTFTAWGYPSGPRLSWHNDGGAGRLGAFVYFVHPEWRPGWGGELAIVDCDGDGCAADSPLSILDTGPIPVLVRPRPNRLVLLKSHTLHAVQRVDPTAGDNLRKTFTGFVSSRVDG
ncbi:MAG: 2OG-Fe(II) oxygenase [Actinomycetota bacterium]|nr:2OG-Fe(II) oxygenase [Actinomycetota bacterium]